MVWLRFTAALLAFTAGVAALVVVAVLIAADRIDLDHEDGDDRGPLDRAALRSSRVRFAARSSAHHPYEEHRRIWQRLHRVAAPR